MRVWTEELSLEENRKLGVVHTSRLGKGKGVERQYRRSLLLRRALAMSEWDTLVWCADRIFFFVRELAVVMSER